MSRYSLSFAALIIVGAIVSHNPALLVIAPLFAGLERLLFART
jgi:hypothetical protein